MPRFPKSKPQPQAPGRRLASGCAMLRSPRRAVPAQNTDPILLAKLMAMRTLILNLFAAASKGPLTDESLRKMLAYADSVKQQKADEFLAKLRLKNGSKPSEEVP
jgi:hypothetical protein